MLDSIQARGPVIKANPSANKNVRPTPSAVTDDKSVRETSRKVLIKDLDCPQDSIDINAILFNAEQLANMIEEEVKLLNFYDRFSTLLAKTAKTIKHIEKKSINLFIIEFRETEMLSLEVV